VSGPSGAGAGAAGAWVIAFVATLALQRFFELAVSARHEVRLRAMGAREHARGHFPIFILLHALFPLALLFEVFGLGARPPRAWPLWLVLFAAAQVLRFAAIRALGVRWHVRIWVVPGLAPVAHGPYRFLRHPNYVAVTVELLAASLLFGAWRTAILVSALNLVALAIRIRAEDKALRGPDTSSG
jgi:methyltransferase